MQKKPPRGGIEPVNENGADSHWLTDIVGGMLLSFALVMLCRSAVSVVGVANVLSVVE